MIELFFLAQAAAVPSGGAPDLIELSGIVAPYAECEFRHRAELEASAQKWSEAARKKYAEPENAEAVSKANNLSEQLRALRGQVQVTCGYERTHKQLEGRLVALHPQMDKSEAFWLARAVFSNLNNLNELLVRYEAGIFPAAPPPPPQMPKAPSRTEIK